MINSEYSKIDLTTKNIFIDITGLDYTRCLYSLEILLYAFSIYSKTKFTFEQVEVIDGDNTFDSPKIDLYS